MKFGPILFRELSGVLGACLILSFHLLTSAAEPQPVSRPVLTGERAVEQLKATGQYESLSAAMTAARYVVRPRAFSEAIHSTPDPIHARNHAGARGSQSGTFTDQATAANPANGLFSTFTPEGLRLRIRVGTDANAPTYYTSEWRLESVGYGGGQVPQVPVTAGELKVTGQCAEIIRGA